MAVIAKEQEEPEKQENEAVTPEEPEKQPVEDSRTQEIEQNLSGQEVSQELSKSEEKQPQEKQQKKKESAKTGDETQILFFVLTGGLAVLVLLHLTVKRKKQDM